jgi:hypothetical protein
VYHHGRRFLPERTAEDKVDSYRHVRLLLKRYRIRGDIPTRKNPPRDLALEKARYRRRKLVKRVVGWIEESRRLETRYEKLAMNDVAIWMVTMVERDFRLLSSSDRAQAAMSRANS